MTNSCCGRAYAWDRFRVERQWVPDRLRCYVVGENPGDAESAYFYDEARAVPVRTIVLRELHQRGQIDAVTLGAFRDGGFLFDHAVRCALPPDEVATERALAERHESPRCGAAAHLRSWIERAPSVWVMSYMARNAVSAL